MARNGTEAKYIGASPPMCDIHRYVLPEKREDVPALYDAKTKGRSTWGWMCEECFQEYGSGLGTGLGQRLIFSNEIPAQ